METKKEMARQITLIILGALIVLLFIISGTYAYFTAQNVTGNDPSNILGAETVDFGDTRVAYDQNNGILSTGDLNFTPDQAGTDYQFLLKFEVKTTSTATLDVNINWKDITNTFCRYRANQVCTNEETDTPVVGEIVYDLYNCDSNGYTATVANSENRTVTLAESCTLISDKSSEVPATGVTRMLNKEPSKLAAGGTNYYALVLTVKNTTELQNYNKDKRFTGQVNISLATL